MSLVIREDDIDLQEVVRKMHPHEVSEAATHVAEALDALQPLHRPLAEPQHEIVRALRMALSALEATCPESIPDPALLQERLDDARAERLFGGE